MIIIKYSPMIERFQCYTMVDTYYVSWYNYNKFLNFKVVHLRPLTSYVSYDAVVLSLTNFHFHLAVVFFVVVFCFGPCLSCKRCCSSCHRDSGTLNCSRDMDFSGANVSRWMALAPCLNTACLCCRVFMLRKPVLWGGGRVRGDTNWGEK